MNNLSHKRPVNDKDDNELLGFVARDTVGWIALSVFGYPMTRVGDEFAAEVAVREQGRDFLKGVWQYYDEEDGAWYPCVIKGAHETQVTVIRTNAMGYQEPEISKVIVIKNPSELTLQKM